MLAILPCRSNLSSLVPSLSAIEKSRFSVERWPRIIQSLKRCVAGIAAQSLKMCLVLLRYAGALIPPADVYIWSKIGTIQGVIVQEFAT
jgi:hypothetical protein